MQFQKIFHPIEIWHDVWPSPLRKETKGKQTEEERKAKRRSYKKTEEATARCVAAKKLKRLETRQLKAQELLEKTRSDLISIGLGAIPFDGNERGLMKIL